MAGGRPLRRVLRSFRFAWLGVRHLFRSQPNFSIHCAVAALVLLMAIWLETSRVETAILLLTIGLVLVCEAFNTALEAAVDVASPRLSALAKIAKDAAAGGVLLAAIVAVLVGLVILGPLLVSRLSN